MIKKLVLTEDHLKLINLIRFDEDNERDCYTVSTINPYILSGKLEDIAFALGYADKAIPGTNEDENGAAFPDDVEEYLLSVHHYIVDNLYDIEVLIHQMVLKGGITPGTYKCVDTEEIWAREENK